VLAADSLVTEGHMRFAKEDKVRVINTEHGVWLIAESGSCTDARIIADEVEDFITQTGSQSGASRGVPLTEEEFVRRASRQFASLETTTSCSVLVVRPSGGTTTFTKDGLEGHYGIDVPAALGIASEFLYGAMAAGAGPELAVTLACCKNIACGGPIKAYKANIGEIKHVSGRIYRHGSHLVDTSGGHVIPSSGVDAREADQGSASDGE